MNATIRGTPFEEAVLVEEPDWDPSQLPPAPRTIMPQQRPQALHAHTISSIPTNRELECLRLVAEGLSCKEVGTALVISPNTVKSHLQRVAAKLGTTGRIQAIRRAVELGLIQFGPQP